MPLPEPTFDLQRRKQLLRDELTRQGGGVPAVVSGRAAEQLRRHPRYKAASRIFVGPSAFLHQVRINCLLDGKELIMPGPGLKDGFYRFRPNSIAFRDLPRAVTVKGMARFAAKMTRQDLGRLSLSLLITDALAIDTGGSRLGDGQGFFDLSYAIFAAHGTLADRPTVMVLALPEQIVTEPLPCACWDVPVDFIITGDTVLPIAAAPPPPRRIYWEALPSRKIRKISPLWWLRGGDHPAEKEGEMQPVAGERVEQGERPSNDGKGDTP
ncbi:MAG: 5-formyltetrahydrofolate cyclo-ligase [Thermodesulfobacteriota bacterium]